VRVERGEMKPPHRSGGGGGGGGERSVGGGFFSFDSQIRDESLDERPTGVALTVGSRSGNKSHYHY
jgi:hypothetical protein